MSKVPSRKDAGKARTIGAEDTHRQLRRTALRESRTGGGVLLKTNLCGPCERTAGFEELRLCNRGGGARRPRGSGQPEIRRTRHPFRYCAVRGIEPCSSTNP